MTLKTKPLAEITQRAIAILCRELGAADTVRFINQFTTGHGNYTAKRDVLFGGETLDQIISEIKKARPEKDGTAEGGRRQERHAADPLSEHGMPGKD